MTYRAQLAAARRMIIDRALAEHDGNVIHTARALGLQRTYLHRLIREYGLRTAHGSPVPTRDFGSRHVVSPAPGPWPESVKKETS